MANSFPPPASPCGVSGCPLCAAQGSSPSSYASGVTWTYGPAPGALVSVSGGNYAAPAGPSPGMDGFSSRDFEPAAGVVTGVRWWGLPAPDLTRDPLAADGHWPRSLLHGMRAAWQPGLNEATCLQGFGHPVPYEPCGCGAWAFWREQPYQLGSDLPVLDVIEGSGRVLAGERGFRCQRARIVALHLAGISPAYSPQAVSWYSLGSGVFMQEAPEPEPESLPPDWLDTWRAVISDRLGQLYPGAKVYENRDAMLKVHPPDPPPDPPEPLAEQCPWCAARMTAAELDGHRHRCPLRLP